jgi:hypothetical protein
MSCKHEKVLIEAAAVGEELSTALRDHVAVCAYCREAFVRETTLFSAIDSTIKQNANAEPSPAFLPGFQAKLGSEVVRHRKQIPVWKLASVTVAATLVLVSFGNTWRHGTNQARPEETMKTVLPAAVPTASQTRHSLPDSPNRRAPVTASRTRSQLQGPNGGKHELEVIVPPGEEALVLRFYETAWKLPERTSAALPEPSNAALKPQSIAPLEIAELQIDRLEATEDFTK